MKIFIFLCCDIICICLISHFFDDGERLFEADLGCSFSVFEVVNVNCTVNASFGLGLSSWRVHKHLCFNIQIGSILGWYLDIIKINSWIAIDNVQNPKAPTSSTNSNTPQTAGKIITTSSSFTNYTKPPTSNSYSSSYYSS